MYDILDKRVRIINLIKFQPLCICFFNILCDKMGNTHKELLNEMPWDSSGKAVMQYFVLSAGLADFSHGVSLYLKKKRKKSNKSLQF